MFKAYEYRSHPNKEQGNSDPENIRLAFLGGVKSGLEAWIHSLEVIAENNNGQVPFDLIKMIFANTIADVELKLSGIENEENLIDASNNERK